MPSSEVSADMIGGGLEAELTHGNPPRLLQHLNAFHKSFAGVVHAGCWIPRECISELGGARVSPDRVVGQPNFASSKNQHSTSQERPVSMQTQASIQVLCASLGRVLRDEI